MTPGVGPYSAILVHVKNHLTRSGSYNDPRGGAIFDPRGNIGRIYVELHMTMLYIKYISFVSCCCREDFFIYFHYKSMVDNDMPGAWPVRTPRGTVGSIYKGEDYTLVHTTYESSGPYGFGEDFFYVFPMTPWVGARMDPRGTVGRIYKEDHCTLLKTKYESFGPCGFGEEDFLKFFP